MPQPESLASDVVLGIQDPYMGQIVNGTKNYEFRTYKLKPSVKRIWFYRTAPHSSITHVCEILPARTRDKSDAPLEEDGLGNKEFNTRHKDWDRFDFAYKITSVYELREPLRLAEMKAEYGFKSAPRGIVYLPRLVSQQVAWNQQKLILHRREAEATKQHTDEGGENIRRQAVFGTE
jgi:predicted transcriptional regulator